MELFSALDTRASAIKLVAPGPSRAELERIMLAGVRAPDHGKLAPWRFVVLEGKARTALGNAMADLLRSRLPDASAAQIEAERAKPERAPSILVVVAHPTRGHKVPESEQILAVAAATQNMFLAAHALGFGVMWKTGEAARATSVKQALGLESSDEIVAFLYLGTIATAGPVRSASLDGKVRWL